VWGAARARNKIETPVTITAVWLRRIGKDAQVLCEIDGEWRLAIVEGVDGNFSHIAEGNGAKHWPPDPLNDAEPGEEAPPRG